MKKSVMEKWVAALRSGKYKQCKGQLGKDRRNDWSADDPQYFCCLGVLCKIAPQKVQSSTDISFADGFLPYTIKKWAGLNTSECVYRTNRSNRDLTKDNDTAKRGFKKIADIIEKHHKEF